MFFDSFNYTHELFLSFLGKLLVKLASLELHLKELLVPVLVLHALVLELLQVLLPLLLDVLVAAEVKQLIYQLECLQVKEIFYIDEFQLINQFLVVYYPGFFRLFSVLWENFDFPVEIIFLPFNVIEHLVGLQSKKEVFRLASLRLQVLHGQQQEVCLGTRHYKLEYREFIQQGAGEVEVAASVDLSEEEVVFLVQTLSLDSLHTTFLLAHVYVVLTIGESNFNFPLLDKENVGRAFPLPDEHLALVVPLLSEQVGYPLQRHLIHLFEYKGILDDVAVALEDRVLVLANGGHEVALEVGAVADDGEELAVEDLAAGQVVGGEDRGSHPQVGQQRDFAEVVTGAEFSQVCVLLVRWLGIF